VTCVILTRVALDLNFCGFPVSTTPGHGVSWLPIDMSKVVPAYLRPVRHPSAAISSTEICLDFFRRTPGGTQHPV